MLSIIIDNTCIRSNFFTELCIPMCFRVKKEIKKKCEIQRKSIPALQMRDSNTFHLHLNEMCESEKGLDLWS